MTERSGSRKGAVDPQIDVERLALALKAFLRRPPGWMVVPGRDDSALMMESFRYAANRLVTEYERLGEAAPSPDESSSKESGA